MKKQTAVEWLFEQVWVTPISELPKILKEAKEMEKQQIECAFFDGDIFGADYYDPENPNADVSTNYYNKKYKSDE